MSMLVWPAWMSDVGPELKAVPKACGIRWWTLPRRYFGAEAKPVVVAPIAPPPSDLTDSEWTILATHLPKSQRKNRIDFRNLFNALLWRAMTRATYSSQPKRYGSPASIRKGIENLSIRGVTADLLEKLEADEIALTPERKRTLVSICREWSATGARINSKREHEMPSKPKRERKPKDAPLPPATAAWVNASD